MLILIFFDILVEISAEDPPPIAKSVHFVRGRFLGSSHKFFEFNNSPVRMCRYQLGRGSNDRRFSGSGSAY
ncbi:hypothetical protein ACC677_38810, partial [Rhizobium ruizarguesonis]